MIDDDRPPHGLEYKASPALAPATARPTGPRPGAERTTVVLGPTGVAYKGDLIERGALARAITSRLPRVAIAHDWQRGAGIVVGGIEVGPGDPRLPDRTADGDPWPRGGGGIVLSVDIGPVSTRAGQLAVKAARVAGPRRAWSFGFRVVDGTRSGGVRRIRDLEIYTLAPPGVGAEVKAVRALGIEVKGAQAAPVPASVQLPTDGRWVYRCSLCGLPSGLADRALPEGTRYVCRDCVESVGALTDPLPPRPGDGDEPIDGPNPHRVGAEAAYRQALEGEREYGIDGSGDLRRRAG